MFFATDIHRLMRDTSFYTARCTESCTRQRRTTDPLRRRCTRRRNERCRSRRGSSPSGSRPGSPCSRCCRRTSSQIGARSRHNCNSSQYRRYRINLDRCTMPYSYRRNTTNAPTSRSSPHSYQFQCRSFLLGKSKYNTNPHKNQNHIRRTSSPNYLSTSSYWRHNHPNNLRRIDG